MQRPTVSEYIPAAKNYVSLVPDGDLLHLLEQNKSETASFFKSVPAEREEYKYAQGKWTLKEMLLHIADAERVFAYRALTIARGDVHAVFPNMDEQLFAANTDPSGRPLSDIINEFSAVREATIFLFKYLSEKQLKSEASLFGYPVTPLGFGYIIIGHTLHHINIVKERYL
ncbi:MAG: DinB family protein [Chitinophagaceae bacterium]|nr:DinB family protein [Chitinophagaceae bacterium]